MAKVFRLTLGSIDRFAVAESIEDMHDRRAEIEPTFAYTPVEIQELHIPGYVIEAHAIPKEEPKPVETIEKRKIGLRMRQNRVERTLGRTGCGSEK